MRNSKSKITIIILAVALVFALILALTCSNAKKEAIAAHDADHAQMVAAQEMVAALQAELNAANEEIAALQEELAAIETPVQP